jgi:hypothetical protein
VGGGQWQGIARAGLGGRLAAVACCMGGLLAARSAAECGASRQVPAPGLSGDSLGNIASRVSGGGLLQA